MSDFHINIVQLFLLFFFRSPSDENVHRNFPSSKLFLSSSSYRAVKKGFHFLYASTQTAHRIKIKNIFLLNVYADEKHISCLSRAACHGLVFLLRSAFKLARSDVCVGGVNRIFPFSFSSRSTHVHSVERKNLLLHVISRVHVDNSTRSDNMRDFLN